MECLDQLNSNLVPDDRASTAALSRRCPACNNQNALSSSSSTDNGRTSRHLISSTSRPLDCSCPSPPSSPNVSHVSSSSAQDIPTEAMSSSSSPSSSTVTPSKSRLVSEHTSNLSSSHCEHSNAHSCQDISMDGPRTDITPSPSPGPELHSHFQPNQLASKVNADFTTLMCLSNQESNQDQRHLPHHQSKPIPIRHNSTTSRSHRHRHHYDSDRTERGLTSSAHGGVFPVSSWGSNSASPFHPFSSSPGTLSPLHFYSQQSPKYFKLPSNNRTSSINNVSETTPKVFDQWPRNSSSNRRTQHSGETGEKILSKSPGVTVTPRSSRKDTFPSRPKLSPHPSRRRSRWMGGEDVSMTPVDGSKSNSFYDGAGSDASNRLLPRELLHQLHNMEHHNEDLSAEVIFALQERGFVIHEVLGKGISSVVRRVTEKSSGQDYAVKIIDISGEKGDSEVVEQTKKDTAREIRILRMCGQHENIIEMYDVFETSTFIFLVFEICRQGELFDYLTSVVSLSEKRTRIFMRQLLGAVQFIHENNIVHRDLKPENILLDDDRNIKVSDFGFATIVEKGEELTELCGTPGYLAPEVLAHSMYENVSGYGKEVDMWACGVIMYTLLCGSPPFWNRRQMMMLRAIMNADYSFNSPEWDDISEAPKNLIQKLLVVNPKERLTAREALAHPFFESKEEIKYRQMRKYSIKILQGLKLVPGKKMFEARKKFRAGVFCIIFFHRLFHFYKHPPPVSIDTLSTNPYSIKFIRKAIDTCAFSMYRHWVKRVDNQNRAALFEHTLREEWKVNSLHPTDNIKTSSKQSI